MMPLLPWGALIRGALRCRPPVFKEGGSWKGELSLSVGRRVLLKNEGLEATTATMFQCRESDLGLYKE